MTTPTPTPATPADLLARTQAALRQHGWTQGTLMDRDGCLCLMGAINIAGNGRPYFDDLDDLDLAGIRRRALALLDEVVGLDHPAQSWGEWNDAPDRTGDQVLAALAEAERRARTKEETDG